MSRVLVSPDAIKYVVANDYELNELGRRLSLNADTLRNIRQLCNFDDRLELGKGRSKKFKAADWQRLEDVTWLKHAESGAVEPAVGLHDHAYETIPGLKHDMSIESFKTLLRPSRERKIGGWIKAPMPVEALGCPSGSSLRGLRNTLSRAGARADVAHM